MSDQRSPRSSRCAQPAEGSREDDRAPAIRQLADDVADLLARRDVYADLELAALAPLGLPLLATLAAAPKAAHRVHGHVTALLRIGEHRAERDQHPLGHIRRSPVAVTPPGAQIILELADQRRR